MNQFYNISSKVVPYIPNTIKHNLYKLYLFGANTIFKPDINNNPIFVLGNHKSGTTAISILVSRSTNLSITGGLKRERVDPIYKEIYNNKTSFKALINRNKIDFSKQIIKENLLTFFYDEIVKFFNNSKFIFVIRDPRDNIRSILNRINVQGDLENTTYYDIKKNISNSQKLVIDNNWLGINKNHYIDALAERWNLATDIYLKNKNNIILTKYEDFVKDKVGTINWLCQQLGLNSIYNINDLVDIQYQPKGNNNISWHEFFGEKNLKKIDNICSERLELLYN